jgi:ABC-type polysaccharide/polyol phosphate export permease
MASSLLLKRRPITGFWLQARDLFQHRELLALLVQKDLKIRYRGTFLGFLWSLLNPLLMMAVYSAVFTFIARFPTERYPVFVLSGLLPWTAFSTSLSAGAVSILLNGNLVRRIPFPSDVLPLSVVLSNAINFLPGLALLLPLALLTGSPIGWSLLSVPLLLLLQCVFTAGLTLALAAMTVYLRDVQHLVSVGLTMWFFVTPIIYPLDFLKGTTLHTLLLLNPMTWLAVSYQQVFHDGSWPQLNYLAAFAGTSLVSLAIGSLIFRRLQLRFAEEV